MQRLLKMDWNTHKSYRPKEPKGTAQTISDNLYIAIHICFCFCCVIEKSALNYGTHISTCKKWPIANTLFCADETILFAIKARPTTKICLEHIWLDQFTSGKISNDFRELLRLFSSSYPFSLVIFILNYVNLINWVLQRIGHLLPIHLLAFF